MVDGVRSKYRVRMYTAIAQRQNINIEASSLLLDTTSTAKRSYQYNKLLLITTNTFTIYVKRFLIVSSLHYSCLLNEVSDTTSAKRWRASDPVVLRPDSPSLDPASCASCASCTNTPHLVASGASGDPCLHWVPSGHIQPSNPTS